MLKKCPNKDAAWLLSNNVFPVKPVKKFVNQISKEKSETKLPQSINTRSNRIGNSKMKRSMGKRRNLSEDGAKRNKRTKNEARQRRDAKYHAKYKEISAMPQLPFDNNSKDGTTTATSVTQGNRVGIRQNRDKRKNKRAFSGNTKRIPLETNNKVKLPKISNNKSKIKNKDQKKEKEEVQSEFGKKNVGSFTESQKESNNGR